MEKDRINYKLDNVNDIVEELQNYRHRLKKKYNPCTGSIVFYSLGIVCSLLLFAPRLIPHDWIMILGISVKTWVYLMASASFLSISIATLIDRVYNSRKLGITIDSHLPNLLKIIKNEAYIIETLACANLQALEHTVEILDYETKRMENSLSSLTNIFQKTGIIPILVVLYIAYEKKEIVWNDFVYIPFIIILIFFLSGCILSFIQHRHIEIFKSFLLIVKSARNKAISRNIYNYL